MELKTEELSPLPFAEKRLEVFLDGTPMFILGIHRINLMGNKVYVSLEPRSGLYDLSHKKLRFLRQQFETLRGYLFFCQIVVGDKKGARFAEFFGFHYDSCCYGRDTYIREDLE